MSPLDSLLHRKPHPAVRVLFTQATDPTVLEAASFADARGVATPMLLCSEEEARDLCPDLSFDGIVFLDIADMGVHTPKAELAQLLVSEGVAHGAIFGPETDFDEAVEVLENDEPIAASVFLEFPAGAVVVLAADLGPGSVDRVENHVTEIVGSRSPSRLHPAELGEVELHHAEELVLCDGVDRSFMTCDLLRRFGGAAAYGPILFAATIPASFVRPAATVEDVLGTLALCSATIPEPVEPERRVSTSVQVSSPEQVRPLW